MAPEEFVLKIPDAAIVDLKTRLSLTRFRIASRACSFFLTSPSVTAENRCTCSSVEIDTRKAMAVRTWTMNGFRPIKARKSRRLSSPIWKPVDIGL
jgi:hypothetical protein